MKHQPPQNQVVNLYLILYHKVKFGMKGNRYDLVVLPTSLCFKIENSSTDLIFTGKALEK